MLGHTRLHFCSDATCKGHHRWSKGVVLPLKLLFVMIGKSQEASKIHQEISATIQKPTVVLYAFSCATILESCTTFCRGM